MEWSEVARLRLATPFIVGSGTTMDDGDGDGDDDDEDEDDAGAALNDGNWCTCVNTAAADDSDASDDCCFLFICSKLN